jgi:hypothetical protein
MNKVLPAYRDYSVSYGYSGTLMSQNVEDTETESYTKCHVMYVCSIPPTEEVVTLIVSQMSLIFKGLDASFHYGCCGNVGMITAEI